MKLKYSNLPLSRIGQEVKVNELLDGETAIPNSYWKKRSWRSNDVWSRQGNDMYLNGKVHYLTTPIPFFEDPKVLSETSWITLEIIR